MNKLLLAISGLLLVTACSSTKEMGYDENMAFNARNYGLSADIIHDKIDTEEYKLKDEVMYSLELGSMYHLQGDFKESTKYFSAAERAIDDNYTKSISRGLGAFLSNDNALVYDGEMYEDTYVNAFMALNYMHEDNLEGSLVEARRISFKLEQVVEKAKGMSEMFASGDDPIMKRVGDDELDYELGELTIQDSPFSRYLATVLHTKMNNPDDARIEYTRFEDAINTHVAQLNAQDLLAAKEQTIQDGSSYNTMLVGFAGKAPKKTEIKEEVYISLADLELIFAYPSIEIYEPITTRIEVVIDGGETVDIPIIEHMDLVAAEVFYYKQPVVRTRAMLRGLTKAIARKVAEDQAEKRLGAFGGMAANLIGGAIVSASEQADLRGWNSLPGKVHANVVNLEPGDHELTWNYYDSQGRIRFTTKQQITVRPGVPLTLAQSQYIR